MKTHRCAAVLILLAVLLFAAAAQAESALEIDGTLESLTLEGEALGDLAFLSGHANLRSLTLIDCPAADLSPLASCKRLTALTILRHETYSGSGYYDLAPLSRCERLSSLTLEGACVNDLTPLKGLKKLTLLSVRSLGAADYTPIKALGLKHLLLSGAPGEQVAEILAAVGKKLESAEIGNCALTPEANDAIQGCSRLHSLRFEHVEGIATDAEGWQRLKKLTGVSISGCALPDLRFLSNYVATVIVKLDDIQIGGVTCNIDFDKYFLKTDNVPSEAMLDFLNGTGRRWLYATVRMDSGTVSPEVISALAGIDSLLSLDVQAVAPEAFSEGCWAGFRKLEQLKLSDCGSAPMGFLDQLKVLKRLAVFRTDISQSDAVGNLRALKQLSLISCNVDDWAFIGNLQELELLSLAGCNGPYSAAFTAEMPRLVTLALEDAPIADLSGIAGQNLTSVYLYGCPIGDYAPLVALPSIFLLSCSEGAALPPLRCIVRHQRYIDIIEE